MKKHALFLLMSVALPAFGQVAISEGSAVPDPSSMLDVQSTAKGLLPPRMSSEQRDDIVSPAAGLTIFNTTTNCTNVFNGTNWHELCGTCTPPAVATYSYSDNGPLSYCLGNAIAPNSATSGPSPATSYSVSPALPAGIVLNTSTGQLSGTPSAVTSPANYTFTAANSCGSANIVLNIGVFDAPASISSISGSTTPIPGNSAVYSVTPVAGATAYAWTFPSGWTITAGGATSSVTVTVGAAGGTVSVQASNPCGSISQLTTVSPWRPVAATGGNTVADVNVSGVTYRIHSYTTSGTSSFTVTDPGTDALVEYLVIGGGGGGGGATHSTNGSGGGGAGGYRCSVVGEQSGGGAAAEPRLTVSATSYTVTVGAGGAGQSSSGQGKGFNGSDSVFGPITAIGGGGGSGSTLVAGAGGSGGGGDSFTGNAAGAAARIGGAGTAGQGFAGGNGNDGAGGGGGGGAGSAGVTATGGVGGPGGSGRTSSITGTPVTRAGGGGACSWDSAAPAVGGSGGGGNAGTQSSPGSSGAANTGSGGGASKAPYQAGNGGNGVVIIRYPITYPY
jgi:hypothetical protein